MDLDFDDPPSNHAAPAVRAGAKFKPKGRPQPKKKQVSVSTSQTTLPTEIAKGILSTQSQDPVSLESSDRPQPNKKRVSFSLSQTTLPTEIAKEKISTESHDPVSLEPSEISSKVSPSEAIVPDSGTINQSTIGTLSEENVDVSVRGVHCSMEPSVLRACNGMDLKGTKCDDGIEVAAAYPDGPKTQESTIFGDFVTPETREEEGHLDMETLDIVQEEGTTSSYVQHTGKFQPKPRLLDIVVEEPEPHYSVDDTGYYSVGTNESEFMVNVESRNNFSTYGDLQEEQQNIPEAPREMVPEIEVRDQVPEIEVRNSSGGREHKEQVVLPCTNNTVTGEEESCLGNTVEEEQSGRKRKNGKSKGANARKRKNTSEEPNKSSEKPEKKKFKHSSRRQKRKLEKELLETPDDEIRFLPIRDMLRLVEYKEWLEKKEGKTAVVPPTQESNMNASGSQYYSQGFDAEDEFGVDENEETYVVQPDSPVNYGTYMKRTPRTRWSKQDTELFYEGIREFGSNMSMIQHLFADRTREQMKLKFKLEERRYPLKLNDALSSRPKQLIHFKNVIEKLQQEAAAEREGEGEGEEEGEGEGGEEGDEAGAEEAETTDFPENEEPTKSEETEPAGDGVAKVKESDGGDYENGLRSDGGDECDDADDYWNSYKSEETPPRSPLT